MSQLVSFGSSLMCPMGTNTSNLITKYKPINAESGPFANIMDFKPFINILPFGLCKNLMFPNTAAATSAAMGVLTPTPCLPNIITPWIPTAPQVICNKVPILTSTSINLCIYGCVIKVVTPGQYKMSTKP